jgi:hypothetical protein
MAAAMSAEKSRDFSSARSSPPRARGGIVGPVNMMTLDVIDPDRRVEDIHHGEQAFV